VAYFLKLTDAAIEYYPAAESPQLPLGIKCFLPIAGCRVLERSLRLLPEGLHYEIGEGI